MKTAVQHREDTPDELSAFTVFGFPSNTTHSQFGPVTLYEPGQLVIYIVIRPYKKKGYAFRTSDTGDYRIPGVFPAVDLLVYTKNWLKTNRLLKYVEFSRKNNIDLNALSDEFWLRFHAMLDGQFYHKDFKRLFQRFS